MLFMTRFSKVSANTFLLANERTSYDLVKDSLLFEIDCRSPQLLLQVGSEVGCCCIGIQNKVPLFKSSQLHLQKQFEQEAWLSRSASILQYSFKKQGAIAYNGQHATHIYWHFRDHSQEELIYLIKALNRSDFKVLVTSLKERDVDEFGLNDLYLVDTFPIQSQSGVNETLSMFFKKRCSERELVSLCTSQQRSAHQYNIDKS